MSFRTWRGAVWTLACMLLFGASAAGSAGAVDTAVSEAEKARIDVVARISPSVVAIFAKGGAGGGSGVLITPDGYALTNFHVTNGSGEFMKCGLPDGILYDSVIVGIDPTGDVALIKLLGRDDFPHAKLGDSDTLAVGDAALVMGNPFLLATDFHPTLTYGIVSGIHRYQYPAGTILEYTDCIQVDASINPGNSGGPLFNAAGELIGINGRGSFEKRGRVNSGAGYAISINQIKHFMDQLRGGRIVDHATLGASVATRDDGAVVVQDILETSEVYRRGLRIDDEIVSFAGRPIRSVNQFKNVLGIFPAGWRLPIVYRRDGKKQEIYVRLPSLHRKSEFTGGAAKPKRELPPGTPKKPPSDKPNDKPQPPVPGHPPIAGQEEPAKIPEHLAKLFVARPGFANYHFNDVEQKRTLKGLAPLGDFAGAQGTWKITGSFGNDSRIEFTLADKGVGLVVDGGKQTFVQALGSDAEFDDEPPATGGLLLAMHHLRLLLTRGPLAFSEVLYWGSEPLDGVGERVDVLVAELSGAKSRWYFNRESNMLVGFDLQRTDDVDPCEIRFEAFHDFSGRNLPERGIIRHANQEFARFRFDNYKFSPAASPDAKPPAPAAKTPETSTPAKPPATPPAPQD